MAMAVDTDTLINQAIEARAQREARLRDIDAQSQGIGQQLRNTNRRDRGRIAELQSQARGLEQARTGIRSEQHSDDLMTNLRVQSQFRNAHLSDKALQDQRHEETARQTTNITDTIARLEAKYPNRGYDAAQSDKFSSEVEQLGNQNEMGARSQKGRQALFQAARFHDQVRQKTLANAANKLSTLTKGGLTPEEFANRDHSKDFTTNATDLSSATSDKTDINKRPKLGADIGVNTVFEAGGAKWMIPTTSFSHFDSNFKLQPQAESAPVAGKVNYNVPADALPKGTTYTFSGTETPNHAGDYWSESHPNGLVTHHFASGGASTVADHATPEGQELINNARQQTANRKQYLDAHPEALSVSGGGTGRDTNIKLAAPIPDNIPAAPPVEPAQSTVAAANPNVLVQPYQMGDADKGIKPSVQTNPSAAPVAAQAPVSTANLPKVGDTREVGGVTHTWNGTRWDAP